MDNIFALIFLWFFIGMLRICYTTPEICGMIDILSDGGNKSVKWVLYFLLIVFWVLPHFWVIGVAAEALDRVHNPRP